jgi:hypothetical protein
MSGGRREKVQYQINRCGYSQHMLRSGQSAHSVLIAKFLSENTNEVDGIINGYKNIESEIKEIDQ